MNKIITLCLMFALKCIFASASFAQSIEDIEKEVFDTESAFAKTMADRDLKAFQSFIAEDAVFWGGSEALRGKDNIVAVWKDYYEDDEAPFAWKPETVMVVASGNLAFSTGPVWNSENGIYAYYNSVWRKSEGGKWQIVTDKGQKYCAP